MEVYCRHIQTPPRVGSPGGIPKWEKSFLSFSLSLSPLRKNLVQFLSFFILWVYKGWQLFLIGLFLNLFPLCSPNQSLSCRISVSKFKAHWVPPLLFPLFCNIPLASVNICLPPYEPPFIP